nr:MAG TPA: hypothetical protein [Caudoviricetes sp.]
MSLICDYLYLDITLLKNACQQHFSHFARFYRLFKNICCIFANCIVLCKQKRK